MEKMRRSAAERTGLTLKETLQVCVAGTGGRWAGCIVETLAATTDALAS